MADKFYLKNFKKVDFARGQNLSIKNLEFELARDFVKLSKNIRELLSKINLGETYDANYKIIKDLDVKAL